MKLVLSIVISMIVIMGNLGNPAAMQAALQKEPSLSMDYEVKPGDTWYGIAKRYYLTSDFERVARLNGMSSKVKLQAGASLKLTNPLVLDQYTVKTGDTLYAIAGQYFSRSYYLTILMQYNQMTSSQDLKAGMKLRIPLPAGEGNHLVRSGETLYSLTSKYYNLADYQAAIAGANGLEGAGGLIKLGQELRIPNPFYMGETHPASSGTITAGGEGIRTIEIDVTTNKLYVKIGGKVEKSFSIASGQRRGQTPTGTFEIMTKLKNPWYSARGIAGGDPDNPLGSRWLGLSVPNTQGTKYGIHGTNSPQSIGKHASAGCIRMLNQDVEWLFSTIPTGTKVFIHA
ncbi:LysM peptidoglycan-binding domain-containing protein [Paenibacillus sp. GCM10023252]|uniref:LysM peptidoglycan-binding domain-containing protein n=1 Tax=Paenibacillus sp. GCM10023252 TaxID=3252649 RepID=UPI003612ABB5